jgi:uncharacterized protein (TIGR03083 family)
MAHILEPDDVRLAAAIMIGALRPVAEKDWALPAAELEWSCRYTLDHTANALAGYAMHLSTRATERRPRFRENGDGQSIAELLMAVESGASILADVCRAAPDEARGFHPAGMANWSGFIGMGCTEVLIHTDDIARAFEIDVQVDRALCRRVLGRIFPWAPSEGDAWEILRWAAGRTALPDHERLGPEWYWHCEPLEGWDGTVNTRTRPPEWR